MMNKQTEIVLLRVWMSNLYDDVSNKLGAELMSLLARKFYFYTGIVAIVYLIVGFLLGMILHG